MEGCAFAPASRPALTCASVYTSGQVGDLCFNESGVAVRGLLVRHLVMPGQTAESASIMRWLASDISKDTFVNIMDQCVAARRRARERSEAGRPPLTWRSLSCGRYRPTALVGRESRARPGQKRHAAIDRSITTKEFELVEEVARAAGLRRFNHEWPVR